MNAFAQDFGTFDMISARGSDWVETDCSRTSNCDISHIGRDGQNYRRAHLSKIAKLDVAHTCLEILKHLPQSIKSQPARPLIHLM
jgi:hypothetical protein